MGLHRYRDFSGVDLGLYMRSLGWIGRKSPVVMSPGLVGRIAGLGLKGILHVRIRNRWNHRNYYSDRVARSQSVRLLQRFRSP